MVLARPFRLAAALDHSHPHRHVLRSRITLMTSSAQSSRRDQALVRLTSKTNILFNLDETFAMMRHTHGLEKTMSRGDSYFDCFKRVEHRRTEIGCMSWIIQVFCGPPLFLYVAYFYVQAGLSANEAFDMSIGPYALGLTSWPRG